MAKLTLEQLKAAMAELSIEDQLTISKEVAQSAKDKATEAFNLSLATWKTGFRKFLADFPEDKLELIYRGKFDFMKTESNCPIFPATPDILKSSVVTVISGRKKSEVDTDKGGKNSEKLYACLDKHPEGISQKDIQVETGINPNSLGELLRPVKLRAGYYSEGENGHRLFYPPKPEVQK